tara:strand:- start:215 stop:616 length:402 start_codon:yes stop_codon:yes gene_type:complete
MEGIKPTHTKTCSLCGEQGHNKRSCPQKPIEDTFVRDSVDDVYDVDDVDDVDDVNDKYIEVEETVSTSIKEDSLISHLFECQGYGIDTDIFEIWLRTGKPCPLKNIKYTMDEGLRKYYIIAYLRILTDIDNYY